MEENETLEENLISESLQKTIDENIAKLREKNPKCRIYGIVVKGTEFDEKPLYVQTDDDLNITAFRDERYDGAKYISGGIYALNEKAIDVLADCMERGVARMRNFQRSLVDAGLRLKAYPMGKILDVDHAGDIEKAENFINSK